ncbi:MAG: ATP-dependent helicase [Chitinophagales bacterium]
MPDPKKDKNEQEEQISSFLGKFAAYFESDNTAEYDEYEGEQSEFERLTIEDYVEPYMPENVAERIQRLQQIAASIEGKVITDVENHQLPTDKEFSIDYKNSLNPSQFLAATTLKGSILVIAGAGSGKTRTITYRLSYMIESGIPPESILLLTFTRKAAHEMVKRSSQLLQNKAVDRVMRGTYHAFSNHILRKYAKIIGLSANFTIIDTVDSQDIIDLIRNELNFTKKSRAFPRKNRVQNIISKSRNCNIPIKSVLEREYTALLEFEEELVSIANVYKKYKRGNQILDYDDLMEILRDALRDNLQFRRKVQADFQYIMVDEFQDTNVVQKEIVDLIAKKNRNLMIVGDDSQSIYAFRGANFENILTFPATYPECKVIKLEQNYRSTQDILNFTNNIVKNAKIGYPKKLFSTNANQWKPIICKFYDQEEEADFIADKIMELREKDISLDQVAVLYRNTFHGNFIQAALLQRNIPYVVVGGIKFVERRHVKDIIAYLRLILNPLDAVSWNRILKMISGIGKVTASKIVDEIAKNKGKIDFTNFEKRKYGSALTDLQDALNKAANPNIPIASKIDILRKYYTPLLKLKEDDYETRLKDVEVLYTLACRYENLEKFLSDFALDPPSAKFQDQVRPLIDESEDKPVTLSTIHSAKGLEWYAVFVPHLIDGVFPSSRSLSNIDDMEEERRLFYVACSRAKEQLYLTLPSYVFSWDQTYTMPSRFLIEVEKELYRVEDES